MQTVIRINFLLSAISFILYGKEYQNEYNHTAPVGEKGIMIKDRDSKIFAKIIFILLLSILDAYFTLYLLSHGAAEINPVMAFFVQFGKGAFFGTKYLLTSISVIILLLPDHLRLFGFHIPRRTIFYTIAGVFEVVILWELYLIFFVVQGG